MSSHCGDTQFEGISKAYQRALVAVICINAALFVIEMLAGVAAGSQALKADALDFGADTATYAISLAVIGASISVRAKAALFKGLSLGCIALLVLAGSVVQVFGESVPQAPTMGLVGLLALVANAVSVLLLMRWRDGDSNVRSVWLCSRNDAIGNVAVMAAAGAVAVTGKSWPDLLVAILLASLFLRSAVLIVHQAQGELLDARRTAR